MNGLVLIDKPSGCTSHDVVNCWRRVANTKRVGHLGTLDPMATGLLALVTGTATRLSRFFGKETKTYAAEFTLGLISDSYDLDGDVVPTGAALPSSSEAILAALESFRGRFLQVPPPVSAKKIKGVPAYKLARKQMPVELSAVEVCVSRLDVTAIDRERVEVVITCTAGTYIRSIAHDLGQRLGCGALLSRLRRTHIGDLSVDDAYTIEKLEALAHSGRISDAVTPSARLLSDFPAEHFGPVVEAQIRQGRAFRTSPFVVRPGAPFVKALSQSGELIAIGELKMPNVYHPGTVL
jgi:tRNA pseudouridine55 synthase